MLHMPFLFQMPAITKNVLFYTSILIVKLKIVLGMIEGSVDMVLSVGIITLGGFCALIMWQDFVQMVLLVNICSKWTRVLLVSLFHQWKYPEFFFSLLHSPRFELPASDVGQKDTKKLIVICHFCGDTKHKAMYCDKVSNDVKDQMNAEEIAVSILLFCCFFFVFICKLQVSHSYHFFMKLLHSKNLTYLH